MSDIQSSTGAQCQNTYDGGGPRRYGGQSPYPRGLAVAIGVRTIVFGGNVRTTQQSCFDHPVNFLSSRVLGIFGSVHGFICKLVVFWALFVGF